MKLRFNTVCIDKVNGRQYRVGEVVEFDDKRGAEILGSSLASRIDEEPTKTVVKKTTRKKKEE